MSNKINEAVADLFALNAQIKALTAKADELKELLKEYGSFEDELYSVAIRTTERMTVDSKMLKEKYAIIARECSKTQEVTSVTVRKK